MKISIAICTYNGEKYLLEQLESFAAQNRLPDEVVVCDDGSKDATREILTAFAQKAAFPVKLHFNEENLGVVKNFEKIISLCEGDIICPSDQDDVWNADKLELIEAEFAKSADIGMVYADAEVVDENLESTGATMWQCINFDEDKRRDFRQGRAFDNLLRDGCVLGSSMAFRSVYNNAVLPIPLDVYFVHDNWIALVIAAVSDVSIVEKPLIKYRQHQNQASPGVKNNNESQLATAWKSSGRANVLEPVIKQLDILKKRLTARGNVSQEVIAKLTSAKKHFEIRSSLPKNALSRFRKVYGEYYAGNYNSYSNGFRSAIKDLSHGS